MKNLINSGSFRYWQHRILFAIILGYASFYMLRQNFSVITIALQETFNYSKTEIGLILSAHAIAYGVGKGIWGIISDRCNARYFMVIGLVLAGISNVLMSFADELWMFISIWTLNACFLSMGAPPCIKLLTHWFSQKEIGTKWAIWNSSQQIGAAGAVIVAAYLVENVGWQAGFYGPAIICFMLAILLFTLLRDTPESIGLPTIEKYAGEEAKEKSEKLSLFQTFWDCVLSNRLVLYMCMANMFFYIIRIGILNWSPAYLSEVKGFNLSVSGGQTAIFDIAGIIGGIKAGWICDKYFSESRGIMISFYVLIVGAVVALLWWIPENSIILNSLVMMLLGLFMSGPQILVGVAAADFASKKAAGAANGLTGTFGYIGGALSGVVIGSIVENFGWDYAFMTFIASAVMCAFFSLLTLRKPKNMIKVIQESDFSKDDMENNVSAKTY
jgi:phosphoglycerate transporter family protein